MKSKMKILLLSFALMLLAALMGGCTSVGHDLDKDELAYVSSMPQKEIEMLTDTPDENLKFRIQELQDNGARNEAAGLQNYLDAKPEIGDVLEVSFVNVEGSQKDGYIVHAHIKGSKRNSGFSISLNKKFQRISLSFTPQYTLQENLIKAGLNTVLGMGTVYIVLIFIACIIGLLKYVNVFETRRKAAKDGSKGDPGGHASTGDRTVNKNAASVASESKPTAAESINASAAAESKIAAAPYAPAFAPADPLNLCDDKELVAVITSAIAAYSGQSSEGLIVRSIKRVANRKR